jgi:hypothetical protein
VLCSIGLWINSVRILQFYAGESFMKLRERSLHVHATTAILALDPVRTIFSAGLNWWFLTENGGNHLVVRRG